MIFSESVGSGASLSATRRCESSFYWIRIFFLHTIIKVRFVFVYIPFTCCERVIVRTAIPYSSTLQDMLDADWSFLIVMISITLVMSVVAYFTTRRLGKDIERVNRYEAEQDKNRLKRQLTNNINHELKTPVASIQVCLETLLSGIALSEEKRQELS